MEGCLIPPELLLRGDNGSADPEWSSLKDLVSENLQGYKSPVA